MEGSRSGKVQDAQRCDGSKAKCRANNNQFLTFQVRLVATAQQLESVGSKRDMLC